VGLDRPLTVIPWPAPLFELIIDIYGSLYAPIVLLCGSLLTKEPPPTPPPIRTWLVLFTIILEEPVPETPIPESLVFEPEKPLIIPL